MKISDAWLGCIGLIVLAVVVTVVSVAFNAWALKVLWEWFIVPFGLPTLTVVQAGGLCLIVNFLIREAVSTEEEIDWYKAVARAIMPALISVGMGWVILQFM